MIRAGGVATDGKPVIVLGLSHANLDRLRAGQPIFHEPEGEPLDYHLLIVAGTTEDEIADTLAGAFSIVDYDARDGAGEEE